MLHLWYMGEFDMGGEGGFNRTTETYMNGRFGERELLEEYKPYSSTSEPFPSQRALRIFPIKMFRHDRPMKVEQDSCKRYF